VAGTDWPEQFVGLHDQVALAARTMKVQIGALDAVREKAMQVEAANEEEESGLQRAREALADEMAKTHALCAQYLEAFAHTFEKTLGAYATAEVQS
jgi:type IV secretory pathway VirD2 relaxase